MLSRCDGPIGHFHADLALYQIPVALVESSNSNDPFHVLTTQEGTPYGLCNMDHDRQSWSKHHPASHDLQVRQLDQFQCICRIL